MPSLRLEKGLIGGANFLPDALRSLFYNPDAACGCQRFTSKLLHTEPSGSKITCFPWEGEGRERATVWRICSGFYRNPDAPAHVSSRTGRSETSALEICVGAIISAFSAENAPKSLRPKCLCTELKSLRDRLGGRQLDRTLSVISSYLHIFIKLDDSESSAQLPP